MLFTTPKISNIRTCWKRIKPYAGGAEPILGELSRLACPPGYMDPSEAAFENDFVIFIAIRGSCGVNVLQARSIRKSFLVLAPILGILSATSLPTSNKLLFTIKLDYLDKIDLLAFTSTADEPHH